MNFSPSTCLIFFAAKYDDVMGVEKVTVHFKQTAYLIAEIVIKVDESMSVKDSKLLASKLQNNIKKDIDILQVEILLDISGDFSKLTEAILPLPSPVKAKKSPFYNQNQNQKGQQEIKFA